MKNNKLKFPKGSFIEFCGEYFKVIENYGDYSGRVMDFDGIVSKNFYFDYAGEKAELITDEKKIKELKSYMKQIKKQNRKEDLCYVVRKSRYKIRTLLTSF